MEDIKITPEETRKYYKIANEAKELVTNILKSDEYSSEELYAFLYYLKFFVDIYFDIWKEVGNIYKGGGKDVD